MKPCGDIWLREDGRIIAQRIPRGAEIARLHVVRGTSQEVKAAARAVRAALREGREPSTGPRSSS